jgi:hypothetical protein
MEQDRENRREQEASSCEAAEGHGSRTSSARAGRSVELRCAKRGGDPSQEQGTAGIAAHPVMCAREAAGDDSKVTRMSMALATSESVVPRFGARGQISLERWGGG